MVAKVEFLVTGLLSLHSGLYVRKVRNLANSYPVCLVVIVSLDLDNTSHATQLVVKEGQYTEEEILDNNDHR